MNTVKICEPTIDDAIGSIEVQYKGWLATYPNAEVGITKDDIHDRYEGAFSGERLERRQRLITNPKPNEKILIAKDGEKVVGMCYVVIKEDRNQLHAIYVLPEYHGQGIGTAFWDAMLPFFDKEKDIYVEVVEYNTKAIKFYEKLGFVATGRRFKDQRFTMKSGSILPEMEMVIRR